MHGVHLLWWVQERGVSPAAVAAILAAGDIALTALEIPTGWLADRDGHRACLIAGSASNRRDAVLLAGCRYSRTARSLPARRARRRLSIGRRRSAALPILRRTPSRSGFSSHSGQDKGGDARRAGDPCPSRRRGGGDLGLRGRLDRRDGVVGCRPRHRVRDDRAARRDRRDQEPRQRPLARRRAIDRRRYRRPASSRCCCRPRGSAASPAPPRSSLRRLNGLRRKTRPCSSRSSRWQKRSEHFWRGVCGEHQDAVSRWPLRAPWC